MKRRNAHRPSFKPTQLKFLVITRVPDPDGNEDWRNLRAHVPTHIEDEQGLRRIVEEYPGRVGINLLRGLRTECFQLGEIVIIDHTGREPSGLMRDPSKHGVEFVGYDSAKDAYEHSCEITGIGASPVARRLQPFKDES